MSLMEKIAMSGILGFELLEIILLSAIVSLCGSHLEDY
jgi:hypothetical protein